MRGNVTRIDVVNVGTDWSPIYRAEWDGQTVESRNPFGLDSKLSDIGAPAPRNLHLINQSGAVR